MGQRVKSHFVIKTAFFQPVRKSTSRHNGCMYDSILKIGAHDFSIQDDIDTSNQTIDQVKLRSTAILTYFS